MKSAATTTTEKRVQSVAHDSSPAAERQSQQPNSGSGIPAELLAYIEDLIARGGPEPEEYAQFSQWIDRMLEFTSHSAERADGWQRYWRRIAEGSCSDTIQASILLKKHGYAGDFEIIESLYSQRKSQQSHCRRWDEYSHSQAASKALRNRKTYFHNLLTYQRARSARRTLRVLNVASGPGRDMAEWFAWENGGSVEFDCVELDSNAIAYAQNLCGTWLDSIRFHHANALRFNTDSRFDLVWSAGLFDYLNDGLFVRLLRRLMRFTAPGGEVVIGNFGDYNPTRNYMELLGGWHLIHRSREELHDLAMKAGATTDLIHVGAESEGVNLFLHIKIRS